MLSFEPLVGLLEKWDELRDGSFAPQRSAVGPLVLRPWLGHIGLVEVEGNPRRFRLRLSPTNIGDVTRQDFNRRYYDDFVPSAYYDGYVKVYNLACNTKGPAYSTGPLLSCGREQTFHRLALPLSDDGESISLILTGYYVERDNPAHITPEELFAAVAQGSTKPLKLPIKPGQAAE